MARDIGGLSEIADTYDAFLIDQWGVLHDGLNLYQGVAEALRLLQSMDKTVVIGTNSSKSAERNALRLADRFGLDLAGTKIHLLSSAQILQDWLQREPPELAANYVMAYEGDEVLLEGLDLRLTESVTQATAVIMLSVDPTIDWTEARAALATARSLDLPLIVPSADLSTVTPKGVFAGMGQLVRDYGRAGGRVLCFGKPDARFYDAFRLMIPGVADSRVLAIGDQRATDIRGARRNGFASLLCLSGAGGVSAPGSERDPTEEEPSEPDFIITELRA